LPHTLAKTLTMRDAGRWSRSRDGLETYPRSRLGLVSNNLARYRSRLDLEVERVGLGYQGLVYKPNILLQLNNNKYHQIRIVIRY